MKRLFLLICLLIVLNGCNMDLEKNIKLNEDKEIEIKTENNKNNKKSRIEDLTLEEKIGQLMILGIEGNKFNKEIEEKIINNKPGGLILFSKNIGTTEETKTLIKEIKECNERNKIKLFIGVDEEGGRVSRIPKEFTPIPSSDIISKTKTKDEIYEIGKIQGKRLKYLGVNLNFAPVLDINSNLKNEVIGDRAFGVDKDKVIEKAIPMALGLQNEKVLSVGKHFPGHGGTEEDSHYVKPIMRKAKKELYETDIKPFEAAIQEGIDGIMISHVYYENLDNKMPGTMSKIIINDILREELDFKGIIFSDDMTMGAIKDNYGVLDGAYEFIKSGGDMVLLCHGNDIGTDYIEIVKEGIKKGEITEEEINKKVQRIWQMKDKYDGEYNDNFNVEELNKYMNEILINK